jgi:hypothetical protein
MLFYENARGTEVDQHHDPITNIQIQLQQYNMAQLGEEAMIKVKSSELLRRSFLLYRIRGSFL